MATTCNIYRPTVVKIYDAVISNYSGSLMLNIRADDGSTTTINLSTHVLRFSSGSGDHGFGFRVAGSTLYLETPQPLTSGSSVTFKSLHTSGSIRARQLTQTSNFILINSGSTSGDGGIIIRSGSNYSGVAMAWDASAGRFGVQQNLKLHPSASLMNTEAYISQIIDFDNGQTENFYSSKRGNIKLSGSVPYMYL